MAKRTSNRSSAEDTSTAVPAQPKPRRQTATAPPPPEPDTIAADPSIEESEHSGAGIPSEAGGDAPLESIAMSSEPSEEDIRMRAYHRYLERGGAPGMDFEDWLEAERELKTEK
jgi:hypothetical protein